ncbi:S-layer homology domain-containing protein, partial [Butyricicoccus sp.]|uniref:S-layer homology domain-containing protein n=1 Tax=Butyricicoccus sp. TaxID=2049021 RepID=UPI003D7D2755
LRVAFRGTKTGDLREDPNYSTYLTGASSAGIPIGVYVFSQALNTAEAVEEAQFAIDRVKTANIQLPIVMDYEYSDGSGRLDTAGLSQSEKTANVLAFCNTIRDAGYEPMLYATKSFLTNDVNTNQIRNSGVKIWLAHYTTSTSFSNYDYWQYSRAGSVQGISADVDCNFYLTHGDLIAPTPICGFQDVLSTDWFAPAVRFAFQNRLMNGTSSTQFAPSLSLTRAMVAQVLYNFSGAPAVTQPSSFSDVPSDQWFANAVAWAQQNGIMNGYPNNTFGANDPITRQDFAVVLYHYSSQQQLDTSTRANLNQYRDVSSVASYAQDAMQWAVASKIISGKSSTQLAPRDSATRAECAQMLKNYLTGVASSLLGS